METWPLELKK